MRIVIVGAGHAGTTLSTALRQGGFAGDVVVIGAETDAPYHRPPLSKQLLQRDTPQALVSPDAVVQQGIDLRLGVMADGVDAEERTVSLADGTVLQYDILVLATGMRPRELPVTGHDLDGVHQLRTYADAVALAGDLGPGADLVVVGGGWIGLEAASSAVQAGVRVTVIEREARLLARVASEELSAHLGDLHRARGVDVLTGVDVMGLEADGDRVRGVRLADGSVRPATAVLVSIGCVPEVELAALAGLKVEDGVVVDPVGRTSDPAVFAIGDAARPDGGRRLESIPSALEQARRTAAAILGEEVPAPELPWFWSDQYDTKIQIAGVRPAEAEVVVRGTPDAGFAVLHLVEGRLAAAEVVDRPADFMAARKLIDSGLAYDPAHLVDPERHLRDLAPVEHAPEPSDPHVVFELADGTEIDVVVSEGQSVMEAALQAEVPGIIAECGGLCTCGTCHVQVDDAWFDRLEPADDYESETLEEVPESDLCPTSRLSCQLVMTCALGGLRVRVPENNGY